MIYLVTKALASRAATQPTVYVKTRTARSQTKQTRFVAAPMTSFLGTSNKMVAQFGPNRIWTGSMAKAVLAACLQPRWVARPQCALATVHASAQNQNWRDHALRAQAAAPMQL